MLTKEYNIIIVRDRNHTERVPGSDRADSRVYKEAGPEWFSVCFGSSSATGTVI
jgi:hypothetical protein